ncbi:MAG: hypothetical protein PHI28_09290 [Mangrovibacterium sp.]|nr:hypothetical protein [Mangrovibacterium sp.]
MIGNPVPFFRLTEVLFKKEVAQDIDYSSFNKVTRITEGSNEVRFTYGPEYARKIMERYENSILVSTKTDVGLYEKLQILYLYGPRA